MQGDNPHLLQSLSQVLENLPPSDTDSKNEQSKQDVQLPPVPQNSAVLNGPNYGLGIMSHMAGNQLVQFEGHEQQAHETRVSNFAVSCSILLLFRIVWFCYCGLHYLGFVDFVFLWSWQMLELSLIF